MGPDEIKQSTSETFYSAFIGEFVEVITQFEISGNKVITTVNAFLLDADDDFYFFGENADEVNAAIKREMVYSVRIIKSKNKYDDMLDKLETPFHEKEYN